MHKNKKNREMINALEGHTIVSVMVTTEGKRLLD
jgi:hypothetical protein